MINTSFVLIFLAIFTIFYFIVGLISSRKIANVNDYLFAGRNLGISKVTFGLIATHLGGGLILGTSQKAYEVGFIGIFYTIGLSLGFLILGLGWASKLQKLKIDTVAELFERHYKSKILRKFASLISIITLSGILVAQIIALKTLLNTIGAYNETIFLLIWVFIITYTLVGGLKAIAVIDSIQVVFIICVMTILFFYFLTYYPESIKNVFQIQSEFNNQSNYLSWSKFIMQYLPIILVPAAFSCIEQDLAQKFVSSKTDRVATISSLLAAIFITAISLIPVYFGMYTKYLNPFISKDTSPFITFLHNHTNELVFAFVLCAIIAAITSTSDSLLCAISSNISQDFDFSIGNIKNKLLRSKIITLITGIITLSASYLVKPDIINIIVKSYEISLASLFVSIAYAVTNKKYNKNNAMLSTIFGIAGYALSFNVFIGFLMSLIGFYFGNLVKTNEQKS